MDNHIQLGLGLLSIGRVWGARQVEPPAEEQAINLIETAFQLGIRFFDTAPAYGASESIFGKALFGKSIAQDDITIATKIGEHWDFETGTSYVDHGYDALARSLDQSMKRLGRIDLLQLHKATVENVAANDVVRAFELARSYGVKTFGASVSDTTTALQACKAGFYNYLQFPFNKTATGLGEIFALLKQYHMQPIINRPLAMGALAADEVSKSDLFRFIREQMQSGIILTGTSSVKHLTENYEAFSQSA
ncbi:aldo/keto reductase [Microvirga sp. W0021]|uniref:Aldo/keto reductase n=1 Tax=Hohaiivirga grylli TaxID=3133970 RepID=A0ABV0BGC9_9HYPH